MLKAIKKTIGEIRRRLAVFLGLREAEIFYINGADTLPTPLSAEEEARLTAHMESDPTVRGVLIERNLRLVVYISKKFENTGIGIEDLISIGTIGLIKAVNTFRADKNIKLATYASRCIENEILMYIRKNGNLRTELSIDEPLNSDADGNELLLSDVLSGDEDSVYRTLESEEDRKTVLCAVEKLGKREQKIIRLRFGLDGGGGRTQKEVADLLGISQSYISRLEKKIMEELREAIVGRI